MTGREAHVTELQSGITAFLFTDIEGSTRLWEATPELMSLALARHDALMREAITAHGGHVFKTAGDAFCAVFPAPADAIAAAIAGQRALATESWQLAAPPRVRMAVHAGHAEIRDGDYFGPPLNRVARLLATAHGEQIVVSRAAAELARGHLSPDVTLRSLGEYALKDLQQPERISQIVAPGLRESFPPLQTPERLLRNIPQPARPLIGRENAIRTARAMLGFSSPDMETPSDRLPRQPATRMLTLTGPGGTGKTRLALHLARELGAELPDGAVFVPLASVNDAALVPVAIVNALDPGESGAELPRATVIDQLRDRCLLLVLDNFEQVMDAAEFVAEILESCPRIRLLVTSRERLSLLGEQEFALPPLELPVREFVTMDGGARRPLTVEAVCRSPAVQLFVAHAQSVKPDFAVTEENAGVLAEICARLDGLPLAIELAAARAKLLSPEALLARLDRRLDLLSRGARDLPDRQKTMRDTIAWSYDLLAPDEQRLFMNLAVFAGGAALDAAAEIARASDDAFDEFAELELIESLADKSLIRLFDDGSRQRLLMFETIRDYARERLAENGALTTVGERHATYFLQFAEEAEPRLAGHEQTAWLPRLERDQANLRAAVAWFRARGAPERALRLSAALWKFWWLRGDISEGRSLLESLLGEASLAESSLRAKALNGAGVLADSQGDWEVAARLHHESLEIFRRIGDMRNVAWSLNNLGVVEINQGNLERARELLEENLAVAESTSDAASIATALIDLGRIAHYQGDHERATSHYARSMALFRDIGDESHVARALNNLGTVALEQGNLERALALLGESLQLHRAVGDRQGIASTLNNLAEVVNSQGDTSRAMELYLESHMLALEAGNRLHAAIAMENLATLTRTVGNNHEAQARYREALALYHAVRDFQGIACCLAGLASPGDTLDEARQAAALLGLVAHLTETEEPFDAPDTAERERELRSTLGDEAFRAASEAGRSLDTADALPRIAAGASPFDGAINRVQGVQAS